jgi:hypothetical protein
MGSSEAAAGSHRRRNANDTSTSRMPETGYGSEDFLRACQIDAACRSAVGSRPRVAWRRLRAGSLELASYQRRLPSIEIPVSAAPAGRMIGEHFSIREGNRLRFGRAQGVLQLPADPAEYLRGRSRQAIRTNLGHAARAGLTVYSCSIDNWAPGTGDIRAGQITPGPAERWMVLDAEGAIVADSILSVDREVALLQGLVLVTEEAKNYSRWLLHTAIVERLCGSCRTLLTNSEDSYRLPAGNQHFQRLLGYRVMRLRLTRLRGVAVVAEDREPAGLAWPPCQMSWRGAI